MRFAVATVAQLTTVGRPLQSGDAGHAAGMIVFTFIPGGTSHSYRADIDPERFCRGVRERRI